MHKFVGVLDKYDSTTRNPESNTVLDPLYGAKWTVHSALFFRKIVEVECFALRAAILHECQNNLGAGGRFGRKRPSPPKAIIPDVRPLGTFENQDGRH